LNEAAISRDFTDKKQLKPLVFSHGMGGNRMKYSGILREFASHGMLVVAIDHQDGSCDYTTNGKTGKAQIFNDKK